MASRKSPLRDRILSNSPDPIKSSILRESGMGWNSPPSSKLSSSSSGSSGSITSPLRISKRDSPSKALPHPQLARRSSSSYKHVRNNNLVSKSPFKSQIPTPSSTPSRPTSIPIPLPRRVSGEKRPRPSSMHEQTENENDRPFSLKRERRQSKTFQGLLQKEPVTRSPFKQRVPSIEEPAQPLPQAPARSTSILSIPSSLPAPTPSTPIESPPPAPTLAPSPFRSSLVSRRMHGPRLSGGGGKRGRRKTVTFDERCDVVEFDREESDEELFENEYGEDGDVFDQEHEHHFEEDPFFVGPAEGHMDDSIHGRDENTSYESIDLSDAAVSNYPTSLNMALDPDTSISGLVDEMLFSSNAANVNTSNPILSIKPNHLIGDDEDVDDLLRQVIADDPTDLETVNVAGDSLHLDPFSLHNHRPHLPSPPAQRWTPPSPHQHYIHESHQRVRAAPQGPSPTPPRRKRVPTAAELPSLVEDTSPAVAIASPKHESPPRVAVSSEISATSPQGCSIPLDRTRRVRQGNDHVDVEMLPETPPRNTVSGADEDRAEGSVSKDERQSELQDPLLAAPGETSKADDAFNISSRSPLREPANDSVDPSNTSIVSSKIDLSPSNFDGNDETKQAEDIFCTDIYEVPSPSTPEKAEAVTTQDQTAELRIEMPLGQSSEQGSSSPSGLGNSNGQGSKREGTGRSRISKKDVKRRLMTRRSFGSPDSSDIPDPAIPAFEMDESEDGISEDEREEEEKDQLSTMTDSSAEMATIERAEKRILTPASIEDGKDLGMLGAGHRLQFDFGSKFGLGGFGTGNAGKEGQHMDEGTMEATTSTSITETGSVKSGGNLKMGTEEIDVDMDMRSALDRLMEDVAGRRVGDSKSTEEENSYQRQQSHPSTPTYTQPNGIDHSDSALLHDSFASRNPSGSSIVTVPPVPPKDNIRTREQMIIEKRREARRMEESEAMGYYTPPKMNGQGKRGQELLGVGRPNRRRSMSTGDAEALRGGQEKGDILLDLSVGRAAVNDDLLGDTIEKELRKWENKPHKSKYLVREREGTIYASSSDPDCISHMAGPGDVNAGKAWRPVRRPSDMNEYSKQIKEYRAQEKPGKAYGKVFVKVLGIKGMHLPLPSQPTVLTCTLNNGIHFVSTPECQLGRDARIEQEFELIEHSKLEFTLTLKIRRDPHIIAQLKALTPAPPPAPPPIIQTSSKGGMRSFFSSSPKKSSKDKIAAQLPSSTQQLPENLARYLKPDGTLARAFISFKDVAPRCDVRLFETSYPLIGQRIELGGKLSTLQVGEIVLQMFRLPPLPGIAPAQLPQSLEECHRGLRHINWHKMTYFEGTLTQFGGDCSTWRRRQLRVIGANMVAFNDVTKKATATIDLKKAIAVEDDQEASSTTRSNRLVDEYDGLYGMGRSFRLLFAQEQEIVFFADTDEEKARWLEVLRALVGHIPPHPLWGELLWQRQDELTKRAEGAPDSSRPITQTISPHAPVTNHHR